MVAAQRNGKDSPRMTKRRDGSGTSGDSPAGARRGRGCVLVLVVLFALLVPAWSGVKEAPGEAHQKGEPLRGTIRISGAWALYPMAVKWGEEFRKRYPAVRVDISAGGAGKGMTDALTGLVDIGMVSREITPQEVKGGAFFVAVVKDAVFPTMNQGNPAMKSLWVGKGIKKERLVDLWIRGLPLTWGDITGGSFSQKVRVYTRSDSCGAAETWAQYLGGKHQEDLKGVGVYGDPGLAEAVRKDLYGVGYNNLNYAYDFRTGFPLSGLSILPLDLNGNGRIDPEEDLGTKKQAVQAIHSGVYPSPPSRPLYLATKERFKGLSKIFVEWVLTEGQKWVEEVGYIPLTPSQAKEALRKLDS